LHCLCIFRLVKFTFWITSSLFKSLLYYHFHICTCSCDISCHKKWVLYCNDSMYYILCPILCVILCPHISQHCQLYQKEYHHQYVDYVFFLPLSLHTHIQFFHYVQVAIVLWTRASLNSSRLTIFLLHFLFLSGIWNRVL